MVRSLHGSVRALPLSLATPEEMILKRCNEFADTLLSKAKDDAELKAQFPSVEKVIMNIKELLPPTTATSSETQLTHDLPVYIQQITHALRIWTETKTVPPESTLPKFTLEPGAARFQARFQETLWKRMQECGEINAMASKPLVEAILSLETYLSGIPRHPKPLQMSAESLYGRYLEDMRYSPVAPSLEMHSLVLPVRLRQAPSKSLLTKALEIDANRLKSPEEYAGPFCDFLTENPTVFHAVGYFEEKLKKSGFTKLSERKSWVDNLKAGGKYYVTRNGSSLIAFIVGADYKSGNGVAMIAGHIDALTARLKPISQKRTTAGYEQLGVAPYAGALNETWWDRDLGIGGRVLVKDDEGKITTKLVKLDWPIAKIPTLAPHFGVGMLGQKNPETQAVPIIGLDNSDLSSTSDEALSAEGTFAATQPPKLVRAISKQLGVTDYSSIVNWELELFDTQPAQLTGLDKEFLSGGRIDDKLCSWAAIEGLLASDAEASSSAPDGVVKLVGLFDDEEIGSLLRQGARGNFLPSTIERIVECFGQGSSANVLSQTYANSFLVSADVSHAVNPNFLSKYLEGHSPRLNVGLVVSADSNGHMTTDSVSTAMLARIAARSDNTLQVFMIRNDSRSGGTVGPMLSSAMGVRAVDAGIPQLSMHSIRATTGSQDPGLGVKIFKGFFDHYEAVDAEFA